MHTGSMGQQCRPGFSIQVRDTWRQRVTLFCRVTSRFVAIGLHLGLVVVDYDGKQMQLSFGCTIWHIQFKKHVSNNRVLTLYPSIASNSPWSYWHLLNHSDESLTPAVIRSSSSNLSRILRERYTVCVCYCGCTGSHGTTVAMRAPYIVPKYCAN